MSKGITDEGVHMHGQSKGVQRRDTKGTGTDGGVQRKGVQKEGFRGPGRVQTKEYRMRVARKG